MRLWKGLDEVLPTHHSFRCVCVLLEPQSRSGDKPAKFQVVLSPNGTAVLKGLRRGLEKLGSDFRPRVCVLSYHLLSTRVIQLKPVGTDIKRAKKKKQRKKRRSIRYRNSDHAKGEEKNEYTCSTYSSNTAVIQQ